jgi:hypothetical protein
MKYKISSVEADIPESLRCQGTKPDTAAEPERGPRRKTLSKNVPAGPSKKRSVWRVSENDENRLTRIFSAAFSKETGPCRIDPESLYFLFYPGVR